MGLVTSSLPHTLVRTCSVYTPNFPFPEKNNPSPKKSNTPCFSNGVFSQWCVLRSKARDICRGREQIGPVQLACSLGVGRSKLFRVFSSDGSSADRGLLVFKCSSDRDMQLRLRSLTNDSAAVLVLLRFWFCFGSWKTGFWFQWFQFPGLVQFSRPLGGSTWLPRSHFSCLSQKLPLWKAQVKDLNNIVSKHLVLSKMGSVGGVHPRM